MTTETKELKDRRISARFDEETRQRLNRISVLGGMPIVNVIRILENRALARKITNWSALVKNESVLTWKLTMRIEPKRYEHFDRQGLTNGIPRGVLIRTMVEFELSQMKGDEL